MAATLESALVVIDEASAPLRGLRREVRAGQRDAHVSAEALGEMAGPKAGRELQQIADRTRSLRVEIGGLRDELTVAGRSLETYGYRVSSSIREGGQARLAADRAAGSLRTLGSVDVRSGVHVSGIAQSRAELAALRVARAAGGRGGGGPGGQTAAYLGTGGAGVVTSGTRSLGAAAVVALPVVQALAGATGAVVGSLAGAGLGVGAVGLAGGGIVAAGLGSVAAVAKPAQESLKAATRAQTAHTEALRDFGQESMQARIAKRELDQALGDEVGLRRAVREVGAFRTDWRDLTAPGRRQWFGLRGDVAQISRRVAPRMARNSNVAVAAARTAGVSQARFLANDEMQATAAILTREFARDLPIAEHALEDVELVLARLARASRPFFREGVEWIDQTTAGWERSTRDVGRLRREISGYVDDARAWGNLSGSALELARDVLMGGRPAGSSAVRELTVTLDRWDRWVEANPEKMDRFFRDAVDDTAAIAGAVVSIGRGLHELGQDLRPLIGPLTGMLSLAGAVSSELSPGAAATLFLGARSMRRGGAQGQAPGVTSTGGAGDAAPWILGGGSVGAGAGARMSARGAAAYGASRGLGASRVAAGLGAAPRLAGGLGMRAASAVARIAWPVALLGGLQGALAGDGSNQGDDPLSTSMWAVRNFGQGIGAMFGVGEMPMGTEQRATRGIARATQLVSQLPGGDAPTTRQARAAARSLAPELAKAEQAAADASSNRNDFAEAMAFLKALRAQARDYRNIARAAEHAAVVDRNQRSREHGSELSASFGEAFDIRAGAQGIDAAMDTTVQEVLAKMRSMNRVGAKILGENTLGWAREQARTNPTLADEVDWLATHIERGFSKMGQRVQVVNARILTGSAREWRSLTAALIDPAERARQEVTQAFTAVEQQAAGSLTAMGYTPREARALVRGIVSGKVSPGQAAVMTGAGQPLLQSQSNLAKSHGQPGIGDGPGLVTGARRSALADGAMHAPSRAAHPLLGHRAAAGGLPAALLAMDTASASLRRVPLTGSAARLRGVPAPLAHTAGERVASVDLPLTIAARAYRGGAAIAPYAPYTEPVRSPTGLSRGGVASGSAGADAWVRRSAAPGAGYTRLTKVRFMTTSSDGRTVIRDELIKGSLDGLNVMSEQQLKAIIEPLINRFQAALAADLVAEIDAAEASAVDRVVRHTWRRRPKPACAAVRRPSD